MRTAVILHGNLRTFFMPIRETPHLRICDLIYSNIVACNNADLFLVTDTMDFFYDGVQYFNETQRGQITDTAGDIAFHDVIDFIDSTAARSLLNSKLTELFGGFLKAIEIHDIIDVTLDPKFILLMKDKDAGCFPQRLVNQYLKIKRGGELLLEHEKKTGIHYDIIFRGRLDNLYGHTPLNISNYDHGNFDIFIPEFVGNLFIYDWAAFGNRKAMNFSINLYDNLGYTLAKRLYRCECAICRLVHCGEKTKCSCNGEMFYSEMTLAPEHHLFRIFQDNGIRFTSSKYPMAPYRYRQL